MCSDTSDPERSRRDEHTVAQPSPSTGAEAEARKAARAYARFSAVLLGSLAAVAVLLGVLNFSQGPRLSAIQVDPVAVSTEPSQTVTLIANQPLAAVTTQQVTVTPAVPFTVESTGERVVVRFAGPLAYGTEYVVSAEVRGLQTAAQATLGEAFVTQDPLVNVLVRDDSGPDRIERQRLISGKDRETVFSAPRIETYALLGEELLVVATGADEQPVVGTVSQEDGAITPFVTGDFAAITQLRAEPSARMAGYVLAGVGLRGQAFRGTLLLQDLRFGAGPPIEVLGPDLRPLEVADWAFEAGKPSIVAQDYAGAWYRFAPLQGDVAAKPLAGPPASWEAKGAGVELGDARISLVDATGHAAERWQQGTQLVVGTTDAADSDSDSDSEPASHLFSPAAESSSIGRVCASPNSEFVAVEVVSVEGVADGYLSEAGFSRTTTSFVRVANGEVVAQLGGMLPSWCG